MNSGIDDIANLLMNANSTSNPYLLFKEAVAEQAFPKGSKSFFINLLVLGLIDVLILICYSTSMIIQMRNANFYLFRVEDGSRGRFIVPHSFLWMSSAWFFYLSNIIYLYKIYLRGTGVEVFDIAATSFFTWVPAFFASWLATWALSAKYIQKLTNSTSIFTSGLTFNLVSVGVPIIYLASILPLGFILQNRASIAMNSIHQLLAVLDEGAATYDPTTFSILDLVPHVLPQVKRTEDLVNGFYNSVTGVAGLWAAWAVVLLVFGTTFSVLQLRSLNKALKAASDSPSKHPSSTALQSQAIKSNFFTLIMVVTTFSFMTLVFVADSLYISLKPFQALGESNGICIEALTSLYAFSLPGLIASLLVLRLSIRSLLKSNSSKNRLSTIIVPGKSYTTFASPHEFRREEFRSKFMGSLDYSFEGRGDGVFGIGGGGGGGGGGKKGLNLELVECFSPIGLVHVMRKSSVTIEEGLEEEEEEKKRIDF